MHEPQQPTKPTTDDIFIGRQPIYNRKLDLVGYELLYRDNEQNRASFGDGDAASTQVIINTFMELGLENIVGSHAAYINLTRGFFSGEHPLPLGREQVVLEFIEDIEPDEEVLAGLQRLKNSGYTIALDDFILEESRRPLLEYADIVKLDLPTTPRESLPSLIESYKKQGLELLAEKVETQEEFEHCMALGFDYFQGFFFCKPKIIKGRSLPTNRLAIMNLLAKVQDPKVEITELEEMISQNVTLSYRLLRYINCASYAMRREVDSVHQALLLLGLHNIKNWLSLMLMSKGGNDKPRELMTTALVRARMCERLAKSQPGLTPEQAFTVGLFSVIDALMDQPMEELLDAMPLAVGIKLALLGDDSPLGRVLATVLAYERGDWDAMTGLDMSSHDYLDHYLDSVQWADQASRTLYEPANNA